MDARMPPPSHTPADYPKYANHYRPRTREGWIAVVLFVALFWMTQPPWVTLWANRNEPWIFGLPFLYAYLLFLYVALIGVLIWTHRRRV